MPVFVYILFSKSSGKHYIGQSNDPIRRLAQHNDPEYRGWSKRHAPWEILHVESHASRAEAMQTERYLKSFKNPDS
ncbi:MAG TPA: GIY-YIG nuclease family protein, partial [Candidatus Paceibacterota bacterium]|nr:GIY-YIG nuclease family protein [Candidatus Paceibacterota bacterium]